MEKRSESFSNLAPIKTKKVEDDDPWKIKMVLTEYDVEKGRFYKHLDNKEAEENILKHWPDMMIKRATHDDIKMDDVQVLDTNSQHQVNFRIYPWKHSCSYYIPLLFKALGAAILFSSDSFVLLDAIPSTLRFRLLKPSPR